MDAPVVHFLTDDESRRIVNASEGACWCDGPQPLPSSRTKTGSRPERPAVNSAKSAQPSSVSTTWRGFPDLLSRTVIVPASAGSVASDVFGVSDRAMLRALIEAAASAEAIADLVSARLRHKRGDRILALDGRVEEHHRFLLAMQVRRLEAIEADIAALVARAACQRADRRPSISSSILKIMSGSATRSQTPY